jgi:hypothetical protein
MWVITVRRRYTGVTITGYAIIVIAAVAIDLAMNAMVWRSSAQGDDIERVIGRGDRHGEMFQP